MEETAISAEEVLQQLRAIALADVTGAMTVQDGNLTVRDTDSLPPELRLAVSSVEKSAGGLKVKFYDKLKALELLGKHLGIFEQRSGGQTSGSDLLESIRRSTGEVIATDGLPEIQQAAAAGNELVESAGAS